MEAKSYYDILGSAEDASQDEIERLYKRLAMRYHPDRGGNAECMKDVNEAYRVLGNEFTRRAYDSRRKRLRQTAHVAGPPLSQPLALLSSITCSPSVYMGPRASVLVNRGNDRL